MSDQGLWQRAELQSASTTDGLTQVFAHAIIQINHSAVQPAPLWTIEGQAGSIVNRTLQLQKLCQPAYSGLKVWVAQHLGGQQSILFIVGSPNGKILTIGHPQKGNCTFPHCDLCHCQKGEGHGGRCRWQESILPHIDGSHEIMTYRAQVRVHVNDQFPSLLTKHPHFHPRLTMPY